jgi:hypothetical protein
MSVIGNATIIILICYILAGISTKQTVKLPTVLSNLTVLVLLHLILLR